MSKTKEIITIEHTLKEVLKNLKTEDLSFIFVDFHAEATKWQWDTILTEE